jgi:hypothetical protein
MQVAVLITEQLQSDDSVRPPISGSENFKSPYPSENFHSTDIYTSSYDADIINSNSLSLCLNIDSSMTGITVITNEFTYKWNNSIVTVASDCDCKQW